MSCRLDLLLVDDDPCERVFIEDALDEIACDYSLTAFEDGPGALIHLRAARPDLMILDLRMPTLSGFDVLEAVRAEPAHDRMKIVMVSNSMIHADREHALAMGAQDYRVKPVSSDGYATLVDDICRLARCRDSTAQARPDALWRRRG